MDRVPVSGNKQGLHMTTEQVEYALRRQRATRRRSIRTNPNIYISGYKSKYSGRMV